MSKHKNEKRSGRRRKKSWIYGVALILLFVLLVLLVPVLLFQLGLVNNVFSNLHIEQQEFTIPDDCSVIVGNLLHTIESDAECEQRCKTYCGVRELFYHSSEFIEKIGECHECKCVCR